MNLLWQITPFTEVVGRILEVETVEFGTHCFLVLSMEKEEGGVVMIALSDLAVHLLENGVSGLKGKKVLVRGQTSSKNPSFLEILE